jgi:hypothetical protein
MDPVPSTAGIVATAGQNPPPNPVVKALEDAYKALKTELTSPAVEKSLVTGVFTFLSAEFPIAAPYLGVVETLVLKLLGVA